MAKNKTPKTGLTKKHWVGYALGDMGGCMTFALMGAYDSVCKAIVKVRQ